MTISVLIPVSEESGVETGSAKRSGLLDGATVGIMFNGKKNAREMLESVADVLSERYAIKGIVGPVRTEGYMLPAEEQLDEMAAACDIVLCGLGDCSSCSALSTHVAIDFERRGVPAVAVCTTPFAKSVQAMANRQGFPDFTPAMVEHPLSSLDMDGLRERAEEALPQVLSVLGIEDGNTGEPGRMAEADVG